MGNYIYSALNTLNEYAKLDIKTITGSYFDLEQLIEEAHHELLRLRGEGFFNSGAEYPILDNRNSINRFITISKIQKNIERTPEDIINDTSIKRQLAIMPTEKCLNSCVHCAMDSTPNGETLPLESLDNLDADFYKMFNQVHFGIEGDALETRSTFHDGDVNLLDYIKLLHEKGINKFTLDVKSLKSEFAKDTFFSIKDYITEEPDINFNIRISFNLYDPIVYNESDEKKAISILEKDLFDVLMPSIEFADDITLNVCGSAKYSKSHIFKTHRYLQTILYDNKFYIPDRRKWIEQPPEEDIQEIYQKYGYNPISSFFPFYAHVFNDETKIIFVRYGNTLNMGRWANYKDKGDVQNPLSGFKYNKKAELPITCNALSTENLTIAPNGDITPCSGFYTRKIPFANISESQDKILEKYENAIYEMQKLYGPEIINILNGEKPLKLCDQKILLPILTSNGCNNIPDI